MPLCEQELEEIRAECFAEDLEISMPTMGQWTTSEARAYFESGGMELPAPSVAATHPSETLPSSIFSLEKLSHEAIKALQDAMPRLTLSEPRALDKELKELGIKQLGLRQSVANILRSTDSPTPVSEPLARDLQGHALQESLAAEDLVEYLEPLRVALPEVLKLLESDGRDERKALAEALKAAGLTTMGLRLRATNALRRLVEPRAAKPTPQAAVADAPPPAAPLPAAPQPPAAPRPAAPAPPLAAPPPRYSVRDDVSDESEGDQSDGTDGGAVSGAASGADSGAASAVGGDRTQERLMWLLNGSARGDEIGRNAAGRKAFERTPISTPTALPVGDDGGGDGGQAGEAIGSDSKRDDDCAEGVELQGGKANAKATPSLRSSGSGSGSALVGTSAAPDTDMASCKRRGNELYKAGDLAGAAEAYREALARAAPSDDASSVHSNLALMCLKLGARRPKHSAGYGGKGRVGGCLL